MIDVELRKNGALAEKLCAGSHTTERTRGDELVRRGSPGKRALIAVGAQSFQLGPQHNHSRSHAFVFFCDPCDRSVYRALTDQTLKLFINAQPQHLFAATGEVSFPKIEQDNVEQWLEFKRGLGRKHGHQFFGDVVGRTTCEIDGRSFSDLRVSH